MQNVIVPNWTPFQAINFCILVHYHQTSNHKNKLTVQPHHHHDQLVQFLYSMKSLGSGFFYESLESLIIKQKMVGDLPLYQYAPKLAESKSGELNVGFFHVEQFEVDTSFKTLENLGYGMFASKLIAYDPLRMKYDTIKYDYYQKKTNEFLKEMIELV